MLRFLLSLGFTASLLLPSAASSGSGFARLLHKVPTQGHGVALAAKFPTQRSAPQVMDQLVKGSAELFQGPLRITHFFADSQGRYAQASFTARLKGAPVCGLVFLEANGKKAETLLLYDGVQSFPRTFAWFSAQGRSKASVRSAPVRLRTVSAPDNSFRIGLPPGFRLGTCGQGTVTARSSNGAQFHLGLPSACVSYRWVQEHPEQGGASPAVDLHNPVRAMQDNFHWLERRAHLNSSITVLGSQPCPWQQGSAAFVRYRVNENGTRNEGFGLFAVMPVDAYSGMLYSSFILSPPQHRAETFPQMLAAWRSWSLNPQLCQDRIMSAARTLRAAYAEQGERQVQGYYAAQRSLDKCSNAWSTMMRQETVFEDPYTQNRYRAPSSVQSLKVDGVELREVDLMQDR